MLLGTKLISYFFILLGTKLILIGRALTLSE
jgi:hypothetical protein